MDRSPASCVCETRGMAKLNTAERKKLKLSDFAGPGRTYPDEDLSHARDALARASANASSSEQAKIRAAVHRKYPSMGKK